MRVAELLVTVLVVSSPGILRIVQVDRAMPKVTPPSAPAEVVRLRAHFDSVDLELRHRDVGDLLPSQRAARTELIGWLRDYRNAGTFPENDRFPHGLVPYFRDSRGVLCAMAYLVSRSGRKDIVNQIAGTRNNAFIRELAADRALAGWLDSVGLTLSEAARIQPTYGRPSENAVSVNYAVASILVSGAGLTTAGLNAVAPTHASGWLGLVTGSAGVVTGLANISAWNGSEKIALIDLAIGATSFALGVRGLIVSGRKASAAQRRAEQRGGRVDVAIIPAVLPAPRRPGLGLVLRARF